MSNRFEAGMARRMVQVLISMGYEALTVPPSRGMAGGCGDPGHCLQHGGKTVDGKPMLSIVFGKGISCKRMSNNQLSRLRRELLEADAERDALAQDDPSLY